MNLDKQKILELIHSGEKENIHLAFEIAKSQRICLQESLGGYRNILSMNQKDEVNYYVSAQDLVNLFSTDSITLFFDIEFAQTPKELQYLSHIKTLYLYGGLDTALPDFIFYFSQLEDLIISSCKLEFIPTQIRTLQKLKRLTLSHCDIQSLNKELFELKELYYLDLKYNSLISLPEEIEQLQDLMFLDLCGNPLMKLPKKLYEHQRLEYIYISNTNLDIKELFKLLDHFEEVSFTVNQPFKYLYTMLRFYISKLIN